MYPGYPNSQNPYGQQNNYNPNGQQSNWAVINQGFNQQGFNSSPYSQSFGNPYGNLNAQGFNSQPYGNPNVNVNQSNTTFDGFEIPDQFTMIEKMLTLGMDMKLEKNGTQFGFIRQKLLHIGTVFQLENSTGAVVATAKETVLSFGSDFEITDSTGTKIGSIIEQVMKSMFSVDTKYTIKDPNGTVIGTSSQLEFCEKGKIEILNADGFPEAKFVQSWSAVIRDQWLINFYGSSIDRRLLIFFPAVSSDRQAVQSAAREAQHHK